MQEIYYNIKHEELMSRPGPRVMTEVLFCKTSDFVQFKIIYLIQNISNK